MGELEDKDARRDEQLRPSSDDRDIADVPWTAAPPNPRWETTSDDPAGHGIQAVGLVAAGQAELTMCTRHKLSPC